MVIPEPSLAKLTPIFKAPTWEAFQSCTNTDEIEALAEDSKGPNESSSTPPGLFRPHCWLTPVPAFLTKLLINARSVDPLPLCCFAATKAIVVHATAAATQGVAPNAAPMITPTIASMGNNLLYVLQLLWLTHQTTTLAPVTIPETVKCSQAMQTPAASWCVAVHQTYIGGPLGQGPPANTSNTMNTPLQGVEGELRTLNASLTVMMTQHAAATAAAGTTTATTKTGFGSFPVYTQRMILHASSHLDSNAVHQAPLDLLAEIFAFPNAAFVGRHVHNLLCNKANHDVLIGLPLWPTFLLAPSLICVASFT